VRRVLLSPAWLGRHLLGLVLIGAFAFLGRWQWNRAMSDTGSIQNLLYAIEWWVFAALVVAGWVQLVRDELRGTGRSLLRRAEPGEPSSGLPAFADPSTTTRPNPDHRDVADSLPARAAGAATEEPADREEDEELAAYNAYLAWLAEHPRR
jgi:DNA-binding transcriptional regulator of glucitol operon